MKIAASVQSSSAGHQTVVSTDGRARALDMPGRPTGGSAVNGGELLMLALATCYCNDLYREAARLGLQIGAVEVEAAGEFNGIGLGAAHVTYRARIQSDEAPERIEQLLRETDAVAEVHNTLRAGTPVRLEAWRDAG